MMQLLHDHPDVLQKVQEEQAVLRPNNDPLTREVVEKMTYANQVSPLVPYHSYVDDDDVAVPKLALSLTTVLSLQIAQAPLTAQVCGPLRIYKWSC